MSSSNFLMPVDDIWSLSNITNMRLFIPFLKVEKDCLFLTPLSPHSQKASHKTCVQFDLKMSNLIRAALPSVLCMQIDSHCVVVRSIVHVCHALELFCFPYNSKENHWSKEPDQVKIIASI